MINKRDAQPLEGVQERGVVALKHLLRGDALLLGADGDGRAVGIAPGDHQHLVPPQPMVPGEDIRREVGSRDMAQVSCSTSYGYMSISSTRDTRASAR